MKQARVRSLLRRHVDVVYAAALLLVVAAVTAVVGHAELFSGLGRLVVLRQVAAVGLLVLGQQWVLRQRDVDLSAPAQVALATVLVIGLGNTWGLAVAVAATLAVGQVVAVSCALASGRLPSAWVTLAPLVAVPAVLPQTSARLAPLPLVAFATGDLAGLPYPLIAWLLLLALAAMSLRRDTSRVFSFAGAGLCWSVAGLATAGHAGAVTELTPGLVEAGLGLGLALLTAGRPASSLPAGMLLAASAGLILTVGAGSATVPPVLAGLVLVAGLAARSEWSTDAEDLDLNALGVEPAAVDDAHGDLPDLAGLEQPHRRDL